jgi:hypothetical protein
LRLNPKTRLAYSVMINTSGANPNKYASGIHAILGKVNKLKPDTTQSEVDLEQFAGYYEFYGMDECYVSPWEGKLVIIFLPADKPANRLSFYKHIEGDRFRRIRDDGELGESLLFQRNNEGEIYRYKTWNYIFEKTER